MSSSKISYKSLLDSLSLKESELSVKNKFIISQDSWYWEARQILVRLLDVIKKNEQLDITKGDPDYWNRIFSSLGLLLETQETLDVLGLLEGDNLRIFLKKFETVFKGPLLMIDENTDDNLARNTLFELKLFSRLYKNGFEALLHDDNPDISFQIEEREYAIECKRLYKPDTLYKNTKKAVNQLKEYSLKKATPDGIYARYGIVAISLSRYYHSGDKLFDAVSEDKAKERINYEMGKVFEENREQLLKLFPIKIPALMFEYSDRGSINMPFVYNFIDVHDTAMGGYSLFNKYVVKDLAKLED